MSPSDAGEEAGGPWVRVPLPPGHHGERVWHYTSASGLLGIIEERALWASSPQVMNDLSEVRYGANLLRDVWNGLRQESVPAPCAEYIDYVLDHDFETAVQSSSFVVSASIEHDLLNQWAHYAGIDGFAVGIDTTTTMRTCGASARKASSGNLPVVEGWHRVIYDESEQREALKDLLLFTANFTPGGPDDWQEHRPEWRRIAGSSRFILQSLLVQLKHRAFADEREVRYIAALPPGESPKFRATAGRLIPYVQVGRAPMRPDGSPNGQLVAEIVLGPNVRPGTAEVVKRLLDAHGLNHVELRSSEIPFLATRT